MIFTRSINSLWIIHMIFSCDTTKTFCFENRPPDRFKYYIVFYLSFTIENWLLYYYRKRMKKRLTPINWLLAIWNFKQNSNKRAIILSFLIIFKQQFFIVYKSHWNTLNKETKKHSVHIQRHFWLIKICLVSILPIYESSFYSLHQFLYKFSSYFMFANKKSIEYQ